MRFPQVRVDIEPTNRCNATCTFCPRHMTPHEGLMSQPTFDAALAHTEELARIVTDELDLDLGVSLCGLGEPLINPLTPEWVATIRNTGLTCSVTSNGALLDDKRGAALLDAGVSEILLNVGERDEEYRQVYDLPWERTRDHVIAFAEAAEGRCDVTVVLVDHRLDKEHVKAQKRFWRKHGISRFVSYEVMNRGGALFVDHMQFSSYPEMARAEEMFDDLGGRPPCLAPFVFPFVGYDGNYYLCCSDWKKEAVSGNVFDHSFADAVRTKLDHVTTRSAPCVTCNVDPLNRLVSELRAEGDGHTLEEPPAELAAKLVSWGHQVSEIAETLQSHAGTPSTSPRPGRRSIAVTPR